MNLPHRSRLLAVLALIGLASVLSIGAEEPATKKMEPAGQEKASAKNAGKNSEYELQKLLVDALDQIDRNYVKEVDRREMIEAAIRGMLSKLDPYSNYMGPDEIRQFRTSLKGEFGGIGIQITVDDGQLHVLSPMFDTPAYKAGIMAGDRILEINGKSTEGVSIDDAVKRLQGDVGESLTLTILHPNKDVSEKIKLKREKIHLETVLGDRRRADGTWEYMLDPKLRIGYVRLTGFSSDTADKLKTVLEKLQSEKMRGLILDLRFNPGGLLSSAVEISDFFIEEGRIVSTQGRNSPERSWDAHKEGTFSGFPMVVLVNRYSASASEIVSACLQDHARAVVIGERTWGKGSVQNVIELEDGKSILKLTTAAYRRPNGKNIHRFPDAKETDEWGVMPNKGFDIELDEDELIALAEHRRDRDIVRKPQSLKKDDAISGETKQAGETKSNGETKSHGDKKESEKKNGNGHGKSKNKNSAKDNKDNGKDKKPFVDRQLQSALKYLDAEIAKKP